MLNRDGVEAGRPLTPEEYLKAKLAQEKRSEPIDAEVVEKPKAVKAPKVKKDSEITDLS